MRQMHGRSGRAGAERLGHEGAPDPRRRAAARGAGERAVVVIADPHADDKVAREADEHGVAIVRRGPGLAEGRHREVRRAPGAAMDDPVEHFAHIGHGGIAAQSGFGRGVARYAVGAYGEAARGDAGISGGELEQGDVVDSKRQARVGSQRGGEAEVACRADHIVPADPLGQLHRHRIARISDRVAQRDRAAIAVAIIARPPVAEPDRRVVDDRVGPQARAEGGEIDEHLERRARLTARRVRG